MRKITIFLTSVFLLLAVLYVNADDQKYDYTGDHVDIHVFAYKAPNQNSNFFAVTHFKIRDGWHIYWKNPGTTGIPTVVDWELPEGIDVGRTYYSFPELYNNEGLVDYIYEDDAYLITEIIINNVPENNIVTLNAKMDWLECKNVCMPGSTSLTKIIDLDEGTQLPASVLNTIEHIVNKYEHPVQGQFYSEDSGVQIAFPVNQFSGSVESTYFFSDSSVVEVEARQKFELLNDRVVLSIPKNDQFDRNQMSGSIEILLENGNAESFRVELHEADQSLLNGMLQNKEEESSSNFLMLIALAYIGGLILNLMPCVFPVIGLKIMGFVEQAGQDSKKIMAHGLVFALGVIVSFWVLSGLLLILRSGGEQLGWGFQLQEPWFNYSLIILLLAFALSLNGVFEFGMSAIGVGNKLQKKSGMSGSFFSGILATVVATPCSAPFLAPALGAALALEPVQSLIVFTFIAVGLSTPYLLLSMFPSVLNKMPRPGAWMETFKQFMAFPLYGTVAYLIWSIFGQIDDANQFNLLLSLVGIALALWIYGRWSLPSNKKATRIKASLIALLIIVGSIVMGHPKDKKTFWEPWSPELVEQYVEEGRTVYVDFTARWCATCQLNKRVVFSSSEVLKNFKDRNIVALKADWTNRDEKITLRLQELGKAAVPVNLVYKNGNMNPIVLPEVLTPKLVLDAID